MRCDAVAERLPAAADDASVLDPAAADHVGQCLRCQAEMAQYRRLRRTMAAMAADRVPVSSALATEVLVGLDESVARSGPPPQRREAGCLSRRPGRGDGRGRRRGAGPGDPSPTGLGTAFARPRARRLGWSGRAPGAWPGVPTGIVVGSEQHLGQWLNW